jgi:hypothetical protein
MQTNRKNTMKKILLPIMALIAVSMSPVHAATPKTIAILDTAIDSSKVKNIVQEVCVTDDATCPNSQMSMVGTGSANIPAGGWSISGMIHGTEVALAAQQADPNIRIVFVRISDVHVYPQSPVMPAVISYMHTDDQTIDAGLNWVAQNATKYNISAVSISQTRYNFTACPTDASLISSTNILKNLNVPVFAGVPDNGVINQLGWPACSSSVISVGAAPANGTAYPYYFSNYGQWVQFMSVGIVYINVPGIGWTSVAGTSMATPYLATLWVDRYSGTLDQQLKSASASSRTLSSAKYTLTYPFIK